MKKDTFYICVREPESKKIVAEKVSGYSEGDIGLHKTADGWRTTHIPTGNKVISQTFKTAKLALAAAKGITTHEGENFDKRIQEVFEGDAYKAFSKSRYEQTVTTVF